MKAFTEYIRQPREIEFTADFIPEARGWETWLGRVDPTRVVRITLPEGSQWPPAVKRGRNVDLSFNVGGQVAIITGRVRHKRLNVAVIEGLVRA